MTDAWARSGAMALTGRSDGPARDVPGDPAGEVERALQTLRDRTPAASPPDVRLPDVRLLGERAALLGLGRGGAVTVGGAGRLVRAADGWVAVSLPRDTDLDAVPALTETAVEDDPWATLTRWAEQQPVERIVERLLLLGLPGAVVPCSDSRPADGRPGVVLHPAGGPRQPRDRLRVLDLSALWAGPLCAHLLGLLGADVVKVESSHRPDGARRGDPRFYDLLHAGHRSVCLDFAGDDGRDALARLVGAADVVIEASRPRALRALGIDAEDAVAGGTTWLSITAYGRTGEAASRVGFGDDIAAGAGLVAEDAHGPMFAGDALADPLTGVVAAAAVVQSQAAPEAALVDVSMHDVARECALAPGAPTSLAPSAPFARPPAGRAARLGEHTAEVLAQWCR